MKNSELKDIINFAIENEVDAYEFYRDAANKVEDENLKQIFNELAEEELEHKKFLEDFLVSDADKIELDVEVDYKITEEIDKPKLNVDMTFRDAIALAMKNEEEAMDMYSNLAAACLDPEQKELFLGLVKMEQTHKTRLEEIYLNVAYAEVW